MAYKGSYTEEQRKEIFATGGKQAEIEVLCEKWGKSHSALYSKYRAIKDFNRRKMAKEKPPALIGFPTTIAEIAPDPRQCISAILPPVRAEPTYHYSATHPRFARPSFFNEDLDLMLKNRKKEPV